MMWYFLLFYVSVVMLIYHISGGGDGGVDTWANNLHV